MDIKTIYTAPSCKGIELKARQVLCGSMMTEGYGMNSNSYNEDDWE